MNYSYQLEASQQQRTAPVAVSTRQPNPVQLLDYRTWLTMQAANRLKNYQPTKVIPRKPKRVRTGFTTSQLNELEKAYANFPYLSQARRMELAQKLQINDHIIKIWFQNRRQKEKRDIAESQEFYGVSYEVIQQPMLHDLSVAEKYSSYTYDNNQVMVSQNNIQESPLRHEVCHSLPDTQPALPSVESQEPPFKGSSLQDIVEELLILEKQCSRSNSAAEELPSQLTNLNLEQHPSCMYGDTSPIDSILEQHEPTGAEVYPVIEEGPATEHPAQNVPSDLVDVSCSTYFSSVNIDNYL